MARARKLIAKGEDVEAVLEAMSRGLTQKMLHGALAELHSADTHQRPQVAASLSRLFLRGELPQTPGHTRHSASVDERPYDEDKA
jgi:glutamyl-tRNA reductase